MDNFHDKGLVPRSGFGPFFTEFGSGFGPEKSANPDDPDPVCPWVLDPDTVNIKPDPKRYSL